MVAVAAIRDVAAVGRSVGMLLTTAMIAAVVATKQASETLNSEPIAQVLKLDML